MTFKTPMPEKQYKNEYGTHNNTLDVSKTFDMLIDRVEELSELIQPTSAQKEENVSQTMQHNTPNEIEAIVEEACAIIGRFNEDGNIDIELTVGIANLIRTTLTQAHTAGKLAGIKECLAEIADWRAKEEEVKSWISKGGVDYIDNKARLDIIEKLYTAVALMRERLLDKIK